MKHNTLNAPPCSTTLSKAGQPRRVLRDPTPTDRTARPSSPPEIRRAVPYIDTIAVYSKKCPASNVLRQLRAHAATASLHESPYGWRTEVQQPQKPALGLLDGVVKSCNGWITRLDLALDISADTPWEAVAEWYVPRLTMPYAREPQFFRPQSGGDSSRPDVLSDWTLYSGLPNSGAYVLAIYACISKVLAAPCLHIEWRIKTKACVLKALGRITAPSHLVHHDWRTFLKERLRFVEVDYAALGRAVLRSEGRRDEITKWRNPDGTIDHSRARALGYETARRVARESNEPFDLATISALAAYCREKGINCRRALRERLTPLHRVLPSQLSLPRRASKDEPDFD